LNDKSTDGGTIGLVDWTEGSTIWLRVKDIIVFVCTQNGCSQADVFVIRRSTT